MLTLKNDLKTGLLVFVSKNFFHVISLDILDNYYELPDIEALQLLRGKEL
jgi:hypothetical protein